MSKKSEDLIVKQTLHAGTKSVDFKDGTKVFFHFLTRMCNNEKTVLDDSRQMGKKEPLELVIGKKFKLEVWEAIVQKLALDEVAVFTVDKSLVMQYPFISKTLRDLHVPKEGRSHSCAMSVQTQGIGYEDLNKFLKNPCNLEFTMELVKVQQQDDYVRDTWQLSEEERFNLISANKSKGNDLFKEKKYGEAADCYSQAIGILDQFQLKEKPKESEWNELNDKKNVLLLNFAQCKLIEGDFYAVIEHCSNVLTFEPDNVKALYRRGKAHIGAWNPDQARQDLSLAAQLDPALETAVKRDLKTLDAMIKEKDDQDKTKLKNMFSS